jgi:GntR family transcriptional regulator/MocR family aminotransferase
MTAFEQLKAEGYVTGHRGGGTIVCNINPDRMLRSRPAAPARSRREAAGPLLAGVQVSRRGAGLAAAGWLFPSTAETPQAFSIGTPALDEFPVRLWSRLASRRWKRSPPVGFGDAAGYAPLRRAIASYVTAARGVRCSWEQVVIVSGAQHGFDLAARLLLDPGETAWVEDPGYPGARSAFQAAGARLVPVPVDAEGMRVGEGRRRSPRARLAHVTPSHQFPLGGTMSPRRRFELLAWARESGGWIVEDDYDSEFRYAGRPLPSLQGLDAHGRVLYLGSFSKTLFPALRLGYLVLPESLVDAFTAARSVGDRHPPLPDQAVVADFLDEGHFLRHLRRMRTLYAERQQALVEAARRTLAGLLEVPPDAAGIHLVGLLPPGADATAAAARAAEHGVRVVPVTRYAIEPPERGALLLGYAAVSIPAIHRGVERLAAALGGG